MKPSTHENLTAFAVRYYAQHASGELVNLLAEEKYFTALLKGAAGEDDPTLTRGLNWHFYPANPTLVQANRDFVVFTLRPTSLHIATKRQEEVLDQIDDGASKGLFKSMGKVLHHIQDMSTPSHVVPVYHGPKISDPFEDFLEEQWPRLGALLETELGSTLPQAAALGEDFVALYRQGGERLLVGLDEGSGIFPVAINAAGTKVASSYFWRSHEIGPGSGNIPFDIEGFGSFGPLGEGFGKCPSCLIDGRQEQVDGAVYMEIAFHYMKAAVLDSVRAIQHLEGLISE